MRSRKWIALAAGGLVGLAGVGLCLLLGATNLDRTNGDDRSRMHAIWSGPPPGTPDPRPVPLVMRQRNISPRDTNIAAISDL